MMTVLAGVTAVLAGVGVAEALVVSQLVAAFTRRRPVEPTVRPPMTVLKPLHGDEPLLEEALTTLCQQDFPEFQIVFGVRDASDPAVAVVRRLQSRFPRVDIALVADSTLHGRNHKVSNLINMLPAARHDVLVIADADVHARPDYLDRLAAALEAPQVGLVTTLYAGLPASASRIKTPSVSSSSNIDGDSLAWATISLNLSNASGCAKSRPETFTAMRGGANPAARQPATSRQTRCKVHLPMSPIRPVSSAMAMKSAVGIWPLVGWNQRNSASPPTSSSDCVWYFGW